MKCPETTRAHSTECNKYLKCIELPPNAVSWITMKCQEGLIYDKNLRSCAIPGDDWECINDNNEEDDDDKNVYGIENLEVSQDEPEASDEDEFLEVIDENLNTGEVQPASVDSDDVSSGDGELLDISTPSSPTSRMITTQLQRLTQLMKHVSDKNNGVVDDDEVTAEDLNSFLATQKIQSDSLDYQRNDFHSREKTPMPSNGRIHPEILSELLDQQNLLNAETNRLTTLSMDATTPKATPNKPSYYLKSEPLTEIKLKSGQNLDGTASHQIVVNRPEGSVLFNVPSGNDQNHNSPYLSEDILKTILEISKQMVTQNHQKQNPQVSYAPQPFYYAVPVPYLSPQNNAPNYYTHDYRHNVTEPLRPVGKPASKIQIVSPKFTPKISQKADNSPSGYVDNYGYYHGPNTQQLNQQYQRQGSQQSYQNPSFYYQNYPQYPNGYQQFSPPNVYQSQYPSKSQYSETQNYNQQQFNNLDGTYYGNRPFVIESSAPSYVEQSIRQKPIKKESYHGAMSYESDDDDESSDNVFYDEVEADDEPVMKPEKEQLICSVVVQRQANKTDCFRYYVCNAKTKEVLSYTCPVFTAFNDQTKFCDSSSYSSCKKMKDQETSVYHNKKIYDETHKALEEMKKESMKVERIASMVREESQKLYKRRNQYPTGYEQDQQQDLTYFPTSFSQVQKIQKPSRQQFVTLPSSAKQRPKPTRKVEKKKRKKRKVKCRDLGNIVDPESSSSYWHCFRGSDGRMKRINRKCTSNFVFCPSTRFCSPKGRC